MYSVDLPQAFSPILSTGYAEIAIDFSPLGKFILAASRINAEEEAQATSLAFSILNFHVSVLLLFGRLLGLLTSSELLMKTVSSLFEATSHRFFC